MSFEDVKAYFRGFEREQDILMVECSTATVELAATAFGIDPARIAKTLGFICQDNAVLIVAAGDVRIDNPKFKAFFGVRAKMLTPEQLLTWVGHAVGGVCPFAIKNPDVKIYLDESLKRFDTIFLPVAVAIQLLS